LWLQICGHQGNTPRTSLISLCNVLGLRHNGRLHSGIDDAKTVAEITLTLLELVDTFLVNNTIPSDIPYAPLTTPIDTVAQLQKFLEIQSKVVKLRGISFKATETLVFLFATHHLTS
jgi:DNA polymerase III epsilon subunit-like protein